MQPQPLIKGQQPLLVVIGNPPYSGHSENLNVELEGADIIEPFKWCDGKRVDETKWLNNDYVKFLRWAQWHVTQSPVQFGELGQQPTPAGVVVLITDNSYLASPTFRGMRRYLLTQFNDIYVINLHGALVAGTAGDQNIFDIKQGVCIGVFVRHNLQRAQAPQLEEALAAPMPEEQSPFLLLNPPEPLDQYVVNPQMQQLSTAPLRARIRYLSSVIGTRAQKYAWLNGLTWEQLKNAPELRTEPPFYLFKEFEIDSQYSSWPSVEQIFKERSMAVTTGDDTARVFFSRAELQAAIQGTEGSSVRRYAYRPFDIRWVYHERQHLTRARMCIMQHLYQPNRALVVLKQARREGKYNYVLVSNEVTDKSFISTESNCYVFPLYLYTHDNRQHSLTGIERDARRENVRTEILEQLTIAYGEDVTSEQVFHYVYAVLNAEGYQESYEKQLTMDFPHIPFPKDVEHFKRLSILGQQLTEAHLQQTLANMNVLYHGAGNNTIEDNAIGYNETAETVRLNAAGGSFSGITRAMWEYKIGGICPLEHWLKERAGRSFVLDYSGNPAKEARIDDYRNVIRSIAAALPVHQQINDAWPLLVEEQDGGDS